MERYRIRLTSLDLSDDFKFDQMMNWIMFEHSVPDNEWGMDDCNGFCLWFADREIATLFALEWIR